MTLIIFCACKISVVLNFHHPDHSRKFSKVLSSLGKKIRTLIPQFGERLKNFHQQKFITTKICNNENVQQKFFPQQKF